MFEINAGYFLIQCASEDDKETVYKLCGENSREDADGVAQVCFMGVINPLTPEVETAEQVKNELVTAAKYIPVERLGRDRRLRLQPVQPRRQAQARLAGLRPRRGDAEDRRPPRGRAPGLRGARRLAVPPDRQPPSQTGWAASVRPIPVDLTRDLRQAVLRPHETVAEMAAAETAATVAVGAFEGERLVAVGLVAPGGPPGSFRVRGMATAPAARGRGAGTAVLDALVRHAAAAGAERIWCNARVGARSLYERAGFRATSGVFELPEIGPHVVMELRDGLSSRS